VLNRKHTSQYSYRALTIQYADRALDQLRKLTNKDLELLGCYVLLVG
jgi:hypothetical protein